MTTIESIISRWLVRWVSAVQRRAVWVVLGILLVTVGFAYYIAGNLGIRGDTDSLFAEDLPFKQVERGGCRG